MPIFMKVAKGLKAPPDIKGDVRAKSHAEWVMIESCGFEVEFDEDQMRMSPDKRNKGAQSWLQPDEGLFTVKKTAADSAGPQLMEWMVNGEIKESVVIDVCTDTLGDGSWRPYLNYELSDVSLKGYKMGMTDAEKGEAAITLTLEYKKLIVRHHGQGKANEALKARALPSRPIMVKSKKKK